MYSTAPRVGAVADLGEPGVQTIIASDVNADPAPAPTAEPKPGFGHVQVVKIGGSVLRTAADIARAAQEIYRLRRGKQRVIAVVSALNGHTDALLSEAAAHGDVDSAHGRALVGLGEARSAALTALACDRIGLRALVLDPAALALRAQGPSDAADPCAIDLPVLARALEDHEVVIVPGFVAQDDDGRPVLLGRGGSDMTAVYIAAAAGLGAVRLVKDVDGVYDRDPAQAGAEARRYTAISYEEARKVGGDVVQDRAVHFAQRHGVAVDVAAVGADRATRIADRQTPPQPVATPKKLRIGLAGCGVVGGGVLAHLAQNPDAFEVCAVLVRDASKPRDFAVDPALFVTDVDALFATGPDIVVDALSSGEAGFALAERALNAGVNVVSANKQAVVTDQPALYAAQGRTGAQFAFSAAIGGGAPMVETIRLARSLGPIASFDAVLNGTVNFMLDRMAQGVSFDDALAEAREAGFAEEDPSADLEGHDAAAKVRILAYEAFGETTTDADTPRDVLNAAEGARMAGAGGLWKQVGRCRRVADGLEADVRMVPADSFAGEARLFAETVRERNVLRVTLEDGRVFTAEGRGAGRWPTAAAVVADIADMRIALLNL